jgi:2-oxoglutarate dehydrogenase E1 component
MHRPFRKPLIIMTPKSLLRHKLAVSKGRGFSAKAISCASCPTQWAPADKDVKRLVLCSGKVAYDLMEARDAAGLDQHRDRPARTALSLPRRAADRAPRDDESGRGGLGAGRPRITAAGSSSKPFIENCLAEAKASPRARAMPAARPAPRPPPA